MPKSPFTDRHSRFLAGKMGLGIFLASLGMVFASILVGFVVIRVEMKNSWPHDLPPLPRALWISTAMLLFSSTTVQWALHGIRAGRQDQLRRGLALTTALAFAFMLLQAWCWIQWLEPVSQRWNESNIVRYALCSFYIFTGLHALHVIGGIIPLVIVTRQAFRGEYSSDYFPGVQFCAMYWHFLDAVWIVLFATLMLGK